MALADLERTLLAAVPRPVRPSLEERWKLLDGPALATALPPIPWLCEPLRIAPGPVTLVAGYGYSRKTMALQSLAVSVAAGRPVWGLHSVRQGRALHLDYEQGRRLTQERYQRLARAMGVTLSEIPLSVSCMPQVYLDETDAPDDLLRLCEGVAFVLVDSLRAAFPRADENSSEVRAYLDILSRVSERTGATIAVIHHARKPSAQDGGTETHVIRGSSALFDACQSVFVFVGAKNTPTTVHHQKDRIMGSTVDDFGLDSIDTAVDGVPKAGLEIVHLDVAQMQRREEASQAAVERAETTQVAEAIAATLARYAGVFRGSRSQLREACGLRVRTQRFSAILRDLIQQGAVVEAGTYHAPEFHVGGIEDTTQQVANA